MARVKILVSKFGKRISKAEIVEKQEGTINVIILHFRFSLKWWLGSNFSLLLEKLTAQDLWKAKNLKKKKKKYYIKLNYYE